MKTVFFGNGPLACRALEFLIASQDLPVAVVVHPDEKARDLDRLLHLADQYGVLTVRGDDLRSPEALSAIKEREPEIGVSVMFGYILRPELLELFPKGCINLHPAYLPYNRGAHPNVWSIVERTPAGVTLHQIDPGVDTGAILAQRLVPIAAEDNGQTLYAKLIDEGYRLFAESWPGVKSGQLSPILQIGEGTSHRVSDLTALDAIDLDEPTTARQVIDLLRARTFPPYPGAYFEAEDGRKIHLRLELIPEE